MQNHQLVLYTTVPYGGKLWWGETLENLANDHKFAKVSPADFFHSYSFVVNIIYLMIPCPLS